RWHCLTGTMVIIAAASTVGGIALGRFAESAFGGKDPSRMNLDEWAGQAVTYVLVPAGPGATEWLIVAAAGFVAFRILDILKPSPAKRSQKLPAGWGIVVDDLVAGVYANILCQLVFRLLLKW
ncbi:hypothetical protein LCGC14_3024180, partial [marine sediment metagenome]